MMIEGEREDRAHLAKLLTAAAVVGNEPRLRALLSNNLNTIIAALSDGSGFDGLQGDADAMNAERYARTLYLQTDTKAVADIARDFADMVQGHSLATGLMAAMTVACGIILSLPAEAHRPAHGAFASIMRRTITNLDQTEDNP